MEHYGKLGLIGLLLVLLLAACGGGSGAGEEAAGQVEMFGMSMGEVPADLDTYHRRAASSG